MSKAFLFQTIGPIDRILSGATTRGLSRPWGDGSNGALHILQSSINTGASSADYLVSYPGHSLVMSYPSA